MRETLRALAAWGRTVLVSSRILSEVEHLADVVGIVARGKLVARGRSSGSWPRTARCASAWRQRECPPPAPRSSASSPGAVRLDDIPSRDWLIARCDPSRASDLNRTLAEAGVFASRIEAGATLEALFLEVTGSTPDVQPGSAR
ncbi:MAG: hypothetical protein U0838_11345 [Chloroflexota bacterium]